MLFLYYGLLLDLSLLSFIESCQLTFQIRIKPKLSVKSHFIFIPFFIIEFSADLIIILKFQQYGPTDCFHIFDDTSMNFLMNGLCFFF